MRTIETQSSEEKRNFWKKHIEAWKNSGKSQAKYCRDQRLNKNTFGYWKTRSNKKTEHGLVKITPSQPLNSTILLKINCKLTVEITSNYDPILLKRVLLTLGVWTC